jgi:NADH-quinone oxidoreductase subunit E
VSRWSPQTLERAAALIASYPEKRSATMPLLYLAMRHDGRLTPEGMAEVAEMTGQTPAQVLAVASFYTMYKPEVGRYLVSVCTSISCMLLGGDDVLHAVEESTGVPHGETSTDGQLSVEHVECIGACGGAPAVQVNYELVEGLTPERAEAMVAWLLAEKPEVVVAEDLQERFGGPTSFDWAIADRSGSAGPVPAFQPYGTVAVAEGEPE